MVNIHVVRFLSTMNTQRLFQAAVFAISGLLIMSHVAEATTPQAIAGGKAVYDKYCTVCHGPSGHADTPVGRLLQPRPRNFADPVAMARLSDHQIYTAIKNGKTGTAMAAWADVLSEPQIGDVMDYIRQLLPAGAPKLSNDQISIEVGRRLYLKECAFCHGKDGRADTDPAKVLHPRPRNLADPIEMARVDDGRLYTAIKLGRPGTAMAGWGELLTPAEIIDLMRFVRILQQPLPAGMTPRALDVVVGKRIYQEFCTSCHGENGDSETPLGRALVPHPRDFTDSGTMEIFGDKEFAQAILYGKPGTAMAPWGGILDPEDTRRVIFYIRQTFQRRR